MSSETDVDGLNLLPDPIPIDTRLYAGLRAAIDGVDVVGLFQRIAALEAERDALLLQAQGWACEAKAQRATVNEAYRAITGATGEPGDWHGAEPIKVMVRERDTLRAALTQCVEALNEAHDDHYKYMSNAVTLHIGKALAHAQAALNEKRD